ncbi:MAG: hypothetical protein WCJ39_00180 [bacterium]
MVDATPQNQTTPSAQPAQTQPAVQTPPVQTAGPIHSAASAQATRPGSKISIRAFLIGCASILMIVVGGLALIFYRLISNPNQLTSLGINPSTTKTLLQVFSSVFFGLLTFLGIGLLVVNLYRLITAKNVSKLRFAFGAVGGLFIFVLAIAFGAKMISSINNISIENILDSDKLIMPYVQMKDGFKYTR